MSESDTKPTVNGDTASVQPTVQPTAGPSDSAGDVGAGRGTLDENGHVIREKGLGWFVTGLILVGELAGAGSMSLPHAVSTLARWPGLAFTCFVAVVMSTTGVLLGQCWSMLVQRHAEYQIGHVRKPYPEIGRRAAGKWGMRLVMTTLYINQIGSTCILFLLTSQNLKNAFDTFLNHGEDGLSFCWYILIVGVTLWPVFQMKSPKNLMIVVVLAAICTYAAIAFLTVGAALDWATCRPHVETAKLEAIPVLSSVGSIVFAYGGHSVFPSIQQDMKQPHKFYRSAILCFISISAAYAPLVLITQFVYGNALADSVINSVQTTWIQQAANILMMLHCYAIVPLLINPFSQSLETQLDVPQKYGWKRMALRTGVLGILLLICESIPSFGPLMSLVGGSSMAINCIILPVVFYLSIHAQHGKQDAERAEAALAGTPTDASAQTEVEFRRPSLQDIVKYNNRWMVGIGAFICVFGVCTVGIVATSAIINLSVGPNFQMPCYLRTFIPSNNTNSVESMYCCGPGQNITWHTQTNACPAPKKH